MLKKAYRILLLLSVIAGLFVASVAISTATGTTAAGTNPVAANIEGEQYSIRVLTPGNATVGEVSYIDIALKAKADYKINKSYPIKLKMSNPPDGIAYIKNVFKHKDGKLDASGKTFKFSVPVKPGKPGKFRIEGVLKFSICSESSCIVEKKKVSAYIKVK